MSLSTSPGHLHLPTTMSWREFCAWPEVPPPSLDLLSPAESVVLLYLRQGLTNREIARALGKSEHTVKSQVSAILGKCNVPTRMRLLVLERQRRCSRPVRV